MISFEKAAELILSRDNFGILIHAYPDGDAVGSGYALFKALKLCGKRARVICSQDIPGMYRYITDVEMPDFEPDNYISVDVADLSLLGGDYEKYTGRVFLSVDHHGTNRLFADETIVDSTSASASELVLTLIDALGVEIDRYIAECIYTGISTDTGCFKYSNTTAQCHAIAARLISLGVRTDYINRIMFETKSRSRIEIERMVLDSMYFCRGGKIAVVFVTNEMKHKAGAGDGDLEGITSIPRQIEGVLLGITIREKENSEFKVSMRSYEPVNAAEICAQFGGGGHSRAAGCTLSGTIDEVREKIIAASEPFVPEKESSL